MRGKFGCFNRFWLSLREVLSSLIRKRLGFYYLYAWSHSLCEGRTSGSLHKKWSFPSRIFSVTVTELAASCGLSPATLLKKSLAQLFSCKFCEISNNAFFLNNSGRLLLFRQAYNHYKRAFEAARQAYANKNKRISLSRNLASLILFSTKVNLLNLLYLSSCLLDLIKQNYLSSGGVL